MGRPKSERNAKTYTIYLDEGTQERLTVLAQTIGISRNQLASNLITIGLEETEALQKVGVFQLLCLFSKVRGAWAGRIAEVEAVLA